MPKPPLRVGSLFSGVGGLELGLERASMRTVFQVEIDDYARRVLAKHWPDVERFSDVHFVGAHNLPTADVVCMGYPCQDVSPVGKRRGITGPKSGLWREGCRVIEELAPRYVIIENTGPGRKRWLPTVLRDLVSLGYDAEWHCLTVAAIGGCHLRDRCFVVAHANSEQKRQQPRRSGRAYGAGAILTGLPGDSRGIAGTPTGQTLPRVDRAGDGVPNRLDRLRVVGNAVHPAVSEFVGRCVVAHWEAQP